MRVLLGQCYFRGLDPKELRRAMPYPPLGTLVAGAVLRDAGAEVDVVDGMLAATPADLQHRIATTRPDVVVLYDDEFNYLTKMCLSAMREAAFGAIDTARAQDIPVLVYASDATDASPAYLHRGADAIIVGEGENTLREAVDALAAGDFAERRAEIDGLRYLDAAGEVVHTPARKVLHDLDALPDPDFSLVDVDAYRAAWQRDHGFFSTNVSTSRGCPFKCNWCAKPLYGRGYHVRSPERVAAEVARLRDDLGADHVWFTDDIFGLKPRWLERYAAECERHGAVVPYRCLSRADLLLRGDAVEHLRASGCQAVWIGAESGSQKILDAMEKGIKVEQIRDAAARLRGAGIDVCLFIQFGYSGEQWEDIALTRKLIREVCPDDMGISVSYPLPGTSFHERVVAQLSKTNWTDSDDLDMLFDGTYHPSFYKALHRWVHAEHRMNVVLRRRRRRVPLLPLYAAHRALLGLRVRALRRRPSERAPVAGLSEATAP